MSVVGMAGLLLAAAQAEEPPIIPAFFTGESLLEICERPNAGQCSMYVVGVLDGVFLLRENRICLPKMNNRDAALIVTRYLEDNPAERPVAAASVVASALEDRFPCGRDS